MMLNGAYYGRVPPIHLIYLAAPLALAWETSKLSVAALIVLPTLAFSWLQDWRSCAIASDYYEGRLVMFDVLTAANYVALARALELPSTSHWRISQFVFIHWALIFVIYMTWNLRLAQDGDAATSRMMRRFTAAESLPLSIAVTLIILAGEGDTVTNTVELVLVVMLMAIHGGLIWHWYRQSLPNRSK